MRKSCLRHWLEDKSSGLQKAYLDGVFVRNEDLAEWLVYWMARFEWRTPEECRAVRDYLIQNYPFGPFQRVVWFFRRMFRI